MFFILDLFVFCLELAWLILFLRQLASQQWIPWILLRISFFWSWILRIILLILWCSLSYQRVCRYFWYQMFGLNLTARVYRRWFLREVYVMEIFIIDETVFIFEWSPTILVHLIQLFIRFSSSADCLYDWHRCDILNDKTVIYLAFVTFCVATIRNGFLWLFFVLLFLFCFSFWFLFSYACTWLFWGIFFFTRASSFIRGRG